LIFENPLKMHPFTVRFLKLTKEELEKCASDFFGDPGDGVPDNEVKIILSKLNEYGFYLAPILR